MSEGELPGGGEGNVLTRSPVHSTAGGRQYDIASRDAIE